ncbi:MAG: DUF4124 domain-containing protein [Comamonas sp.]
MNVQRLLLLALWSALSCTAHAQWQWLDDSDRKVFSDRPPPPSVPAQKVLHKPAGAGVTQTTAATTTSKTSTNAATDTPSSGVDAELEKKKSEQEAEETKQKQAEEQKVALQRKENCDRAKRARDLMQSGQMLSHTNAQGERGFMSDAARKQELARAGQTIASDCR